MDRRFIPQFFRYKELYVCEGCFMLYTVKWEKLAKSEGSRLCEVCRLKPAAYLAFKPILVRRATAKHGLKAGAEVKA